MRRLSLLCFLLTLAAPLYAFALNQFDVCGNTDVCGPNLKCITNRCVPDSLQGVNGLGNKCSFEDCCPGALQCASFVKACIDVNEAQSTVGIATEGCKATGVPPNNTVIDNGGTTVDTTSTGVISVDTGNGTFQVGGSCGNTVPCANALKCYSNICVTGNPETADGFGNQCSSNNCCKSGLVCLALSKTCSIALPGFQTVTCTGTAPPVEAASTGATTTIPPVGTTTAGDGSNIVVGAVCGNTDTCPVNYKCVANYCVSGSTAATVDGIGNGCSSTDCCKTGLVCVSGLNKCSPPTGSSLVQLITCAGGGGSTTTTTTGGNGGLVPGSTVNGNAAQQSIQASSFVLLLLAISTIATILYN